MPAISPGTVLTIAIAENGSVQVNGPLNDKMLCYALLENARDAIKDFNDAEQKSKIAPASTEDIISLAPLRRVQ